MNIVDLIVLVLVLLAALRGWRRGLIAQFFELGGGFLGLLAGVRFAGPIASVFMHSEGVGRALLTLFLVFVFLSLGQTAGFLIGHRFGGYARRVRMGGLDSGFGAGFGVVITLVSFWLIGSLLVQGPTRAIARAVRHSTILEWTSGLLPEPPDLLASITKYLDSSGFPQVFAGLPRDIGPPVALPTKAEARKAFEAGKNSTVRVVIPACGGIQQGSGWIASDSTVVTNAHVVAGGSAPTVQELDGGDHQGRVVLFDPKTDLAVIHVDGLSGPSLKLGTTTLDRGASGATLGYPGDAGGKLMPSPAAVQARYEARGRDIYGDGIVVREIYELRSPVRQGDSGGPFILPDGSVAGVVFAASTTDGDTGYALTASEVRDDVQTGLTATGAVPTGRCAR
jgi:S1-C subfamily serine protease